MPNSKVVALLMAASLSSTAVAASAEEIPKLEQREAVAELPANRPAQSAFLELAESNTSVAFALPDAPVPAMKPLASNSLAFAVPQQPGNSNPGASYPNSNRRKYILLGAICAAAIVGAIVIATTRD